MKRMDSGVSGDPMATGSRTWAMSSHRARSRSRRVVIILVLAMVGALIGSGPAGAATILHVSPTGSDTSDCTVNPCKTIGYAIDQSASGDTIDIAAGTYAEHLVVDKSLELKGVGASSTIVEPHTHATVITIGAPSDSLMVTIAGMTIRKGRAEAGAGISSLPGAGQSNLVTLNKVVVGANTAVGAYGGGSAFGGGIYNGAGSTLTLSRSTVRGNSAIGSTGRVNTPGGSGLGGGIYNAGTLIVAKSTVAENAARGGKGCGGGYGCFSGGRRGGPGHGGGIDSVGTLTIVQSTLSGNTAVGGEAFNGGVPAEGAGGGIEGGGTLVNSTVSGNLAQGGGDSYSEGGAALGGGIHATAAAIVTNSTIASNQASGGLGSPNGSSSGGGIELSSGSMTSSNAILATNTADTGPDCNDAVNSGGHNLLGDDSSCSGFTGTGDLVNVDPMLGPLQDNGGPTFTMALLAGSPAIAAADDGVCAAGPVKGVDQRGLSRQDDPQCDIGAYEEQP